MNVFLISVSLISLFIYNIIQTVLLSLAPWFRKKKTIKGQKVLITGGGNGFGRQLAIQFSKHSTCLILLDIDIEAMQETLTLLDSKSSAFIYECDVTNRKMVYEVSERIKNDVGDVDILVNNAGIVNGKSFIDLSDENILKTMEVNAISHFWTCKSFLPAMMARNSGHIVTVSSIASQQGGQRLTDYCASKYAAIGLVESLEIELRVKRLDGIKVTVVCPSHMDTGFFAGMEMTFGSNFNPEYVAKETVEGILEERETIYIPHFFTYLFLLKALVPRWIHFAFIELTGNVTTMDNFIGRTTI